MVGRGAAMGGTGVLFGLRGGEGGGLERGCWGSGRRKNDESI